MWISADGQETVVIGSIEELEKRSGKKIGDDIHREFLDDIELPSAEGRGPLRRVDEVFDCWFESGSMPYAQVTHRRPPPPPPPRRRRRRRPVARRRSPLGQAIALRGHTLACVERVALNACRQRAP